MPSAFAQQLITQYAKPEFYVHSETVQVKMPVALADIFSQINLVQPWVSIKTAGLLVHHPVAWWRSLSVGIVPMPGVYGRMCTFYGGWAASGSARPTTVSDMLALHGAVVKTYGGTGDPGVTSLTVPCPFDDTMADILKTPYNNSVRPVYYYCFIEVNLIDKPQDADRFLLHFRGEYEVQGRF